MAQESYVKLEEETSSPRKRCRCSTAYVQIICQVLGIVVLIVCVVSIERRLAFLEHRVDSMMTKAQTDSQSRLKRQFGGYGVLSVDTETNLGKQLQGATSKGRSKATPLQRLHKRSTFLSPGFGRRLQIIIPGSNDCPLGWNLEYRGRLLSLHKTASREKQVCVNEKAELDGTERTTEIRATRDAMKRYCKSFPCKPPTEHQMLCAVCTR
ncbi:uncharacterized protein [Montipora foliosa]|uniref:uncharacterized protein n=1 Tax=Montipora foliosa TaxID=591990 RepID=UPI0035F12DB5